MERFSWAESCVQIDCSECGLLWMDAPHRCERGRAGDSGFWGLKEWRKQGRESSYSWRNTTEGPGEKNFFKRGRDRKWRGRGVGM